MTCVVLAGNHWIEAARQVRIEAGSPCVALPIESTDGLHLAVNDRDVVLFHRCEKFPAEADFRQAYFDAWRLIGAGARCVTVVVGIAEIFRVASCAKAAAA